MAKKKIVLQMEDDPTKSAKAQFVALTLIQSVQNQLNNYKTHRDNKTWDQLGFELLINPETWTNLRDWSTDTGGGPDVQLYPNRLLGVKVMQSFDMPPNQVRVILSPVDPQLTMPKAQTQTLNSSPITTATYSFASNSSGPWTTSYAGGGGGGTPGGGAVAGGGGGGVFVGFKAPLPPPEPIHPQEPISFNVTNLGDIVMTSASASGGLGYAMYHHLGTTPPTVIEEDSVFNKCTLYTDLGAKFVLTMEQVYQLNKVLNTNGMKLKHFKDANGGGFSKSEPPSYKIKGAPTKKSKKQLNKEVNDKLKEHPLYAINTEDGSIIEIKPGDPIPPKHLEFVSKTPPSGDQTLTVSGTATFPKPESEKVVQFGEFQIGTSAQIPKGTVSIGLPPSDIVSKSYVDMNVVSNTAEIKSTIKELKAEIDALKETQDKKPWKMSQVQIKAINEMMMAYVNGGLLPSQEYLETAGDMLYGQYVKKCKHYGWTAIKKESWFLFDLMATVGYLSPSGQIPNISLGTPPAVTAVPKQGGKNIALEDLAAKVKTWLPGDPDHQWSPTLSNGEVQEFDDSPSADELDEDFVYDEYDEDSPDEPPW